MIQEQCGEGTPTWRKWSGVKTYPIRLLEDGTSGDLEDYVGSPVRRLISTATRFVYALRLPREVKGLVYTLSRRCPYHYVWLHCCQTRQYEEPFPPRRGPKFLYPNGNLQRKTLHSCLFSSMGRRKMLLYFYVLPNRYIYTSAMYDHDPAFIGATLALPSFKHAFGLDFVISADPTNLSSNIISTFQAGVFFGAILGFFTAERWGRTPIIMGAGAVFMVDVGFLLHGTLGLLYAGHVLAGLAIGRLVLL